MLLLIKKYFIIIYSNGYTANQEQFFLTETLGMIKYTLKELLLRKSKLIGAKFSMEYMLNNILFIKLLIGAAVMMNYTLN